MEGGKCSRQKERETRRGEGRRQKNKIEKRSPSEPFDHEFVLSRIEALAYVPVEGGVRKTVAEVSDYCF